MKLTKLSKSASVVLSSLILGVLFLTVSSAIGSQPLVPTEGPPQPNVGPTFTDLTVEKVSDIKATIKNTTEGRVDIDGVLQIEGGKLKLGGKILNSETLSGVEIFGGLNVVGKVKAKSFGKFYYKDAGWYSTDPGDDAWTRVVSCDSGDFVIGCSLNDVNSQNAQLDTRNLFLRNDGGTCEANFYIKGSSPVITNQSVICWDPQGDYTGSLYDYADGSILDGGGDEGDDEGEFGGLFKKTNPIVVPPPGGPDTPPEVVFENLEGQLFFIGSDGDYLVLTWDKLLSGTKVETKIIGGSGAVKFSCSSNFENPSCFWGTDGDVLLGEACPSGKDCLVITGNFFDLSEFSYNDTAFQFGSKVRLTANDQPSSITEEDFENFDIAEENYGAGAIPVFASCHSGMTPAVTGKLSMQYGENFTQDVLSWEMNRLGRCYPDEVSKIEIHYRKPNNTWPVRSWTTTYNKDYSYFLDKTLGDSAVFVDDSTAVISSDDYGSLWNLRLARIITEPGMTGARIKIHYKDGTSSNLSDEYFF